MRHRQVLKIYLMVVKTVKVTSCKFIFKSMNLIKWGTTAYLMIHFLYFNHSKDSYSLVSNTLGKFFS